MPTNVTMPSLGFDMTQGKVARWLKHEGDQVEKGEAIAEVETEKATVEIEAFTSGVLQRILVPAGETVAVNTPIGVIAAPGETVEAPSGFPTQVSREPGQPSEPAPMPAQPRPPAPVPAEQGPENGRLKVSPIARRMAEEANIELRNVKGSGPGGRIMEKDVREAMAHAAAPAPTPEVRFAPAVPAPAEAPGAVPLGRMRQAIAQRMTQSKTTVPHFYVTVEILVDEALKLRQQLNALAPEAEQVSVNDLVVAAVARTLRQFPILNSSYKGDQLEQHADINIGVAVAVEQGLLTPTLSHADQKSLKQIATESRAMAERARANRLKPEDMAPGTFTISNLGMFGVDEFSAIINPPEAAILAVGTAVKRPIVVGDEIKVGTTMKATLSVDHRVADGAQAARFLQALKKLLENPVNLLLS